MVVFFLSVRAVLAASICVFFSFLSRARRSFRLPLLFLCCCATSPPLRAHLGDGRCAISLNFLMYCPFHAVISDREHFRSIEIQLDSSLGRHQSIFRSIVVPYGIKSSGHSGRIDLNSRIFSSAVT